MSGDRPVLACDAVRELAPDVALGLLTGEERADALAHLEGCERCQAEVASLAIAADEVLLAGPQVAPPPGFAGRVTAAVARERAAATSTAGGGLPTVSGGGGSAHGERAGAQHARRSRRSPRRRWPVRAALGAAAAVLAIVGLVAVLQRDAGPAPDAEVAVAEMVSGRGRHVGTATATAVGDESAHVTLTVPEWEAVLDRWGGAPAGSYWLVVEQHDGTRTMRALAPDVADWSMDVRAPVDAVAAVSMVDDTGQVWCTGTFAPA